MTTELAILVLRLPPQYTLEQLQEAYAGAVHRAHPEEDPGAFHLANLAYQTLREALAQQGETWAGGSSPAETAGASKGSVGRGTSRNAQDREGGWDAGREDSAAGSADFADAEELDFESALAEAEQQEAEAYQRRIREAVQELETLLARYPAKKRTGLFRLGQWRAKPDPSPMRQDAWNLGWKKLWGKFQDEGISDNPYFISLLYACVERSEIEIWQEAFFQKLYQEAPIEKWYASIRPDAPSPSYPGSPLAERQAAAATFLAFLRRKKREAAEEKKRATDRRMLFLLFLLPFSLCSPYTAMAGAFLFCFILLSSMKSRKVGRNFCLCGSACALAGKMAGAWASFYLPGGEEHIPPFAPLAGQAFWPILALRFAPWAQEGIKAAEPMTLAIRNNTGMFLVLGIAFFLLGILFLSVAGFAKIHEYYRERVK